MVQSNYSTGYGTPTNQSNQSPNKKNIIIGVLAVGLLGSWGYMLYNKSENKEQIQTVQTQSQTFMSERDSLKLLYNDAEMRLDSITSTNHELQSSLESTESNMQREIDAKKAEIRRILNNTNATASDLKKAKTLILELNDKISNLETEVTRLTGENVQLTANNTQLQSEKQVVEQNLEATNQTLQTTTQEKETLAQKVEVASTFSASNIQITPIDVKSSGKESETTTARRVDKLMVSFDIQNRIAQSGPADLYIIVTAPDGKVVSDASLDSGSITTREDGERSYTSIVNVNYEQSTKKNVQLPIKQKEFAKGNYKIEIYHNGYKIGESVRALKKGGLFG